MNRFAKWLLESPIYDSDFCGVHIRETARNIRYIGATYRLLSAERSMQESPERYQRALESWLEAGRKLPLP